MAKGRNSVVVPVRMPDGVLVLLKARAEAKGLPYTVLARQMIQEKLGLKVR